MVAVLSFNWKGWNGSRFRTSAGSRLVVLAFALCMHKNAIDSLS